MAVTGRREVRVRPEAKLRIERAAALVRVPVSEFVREAVQARADRVVADHEISTPVPGACTTIFSVPSTHPPRRHRR